MRTASTLLLAALFVASCGRPMGNDAGPDAQGQDGTAGRQDAGAKDAEPTVDAELSDSGASPEDPWAIGPPLGARITAEGALELRVAAPSATRVEVCVFTATVGAAEVLRAPLNKSMDLWSIHVSTASLAAAGVRPGPIFYGLRVFGPNWPFSPDFQPGTEIGFLTDVDGDGNRMNPNKLLLDPYALEISHDPVNAGHPSGAGYKTGPGDRSTDTASFAPKSVIFPLEAPPPPGPSRPLKDEVISEAHLRGLTMADPEVPPALRGTYAGAALLTDRLKGLGVTAIELMPIFESQNDQNDLTPDAAGDNYWGYSTLAFFAPDRRYAADQSPGGPTRELKNMVAAFHAAGLKVYLDVVYNHTAEGTPRGEVATLFGLRGLGNAEYYELGDDKSTGVNSNGVGPNFNAASPVGGNLVLDSLAYWHRMIGVDGYRFDLAPVVANGCQQGCYRYDRGILERMVEALPARTSTGGAGVDLIAEPWGVVAGSYQIGAFPAPWAEWNDHFRDAIRRDLNRLGVDVETLRDLKERWRGSPDLFRDPGRGPPASINYVDSHDGMTLHDLFAYGSPSNGQAWPCGPSDGGNAGEPVWDHHGDPGLQRRAARTALAFAALSAGVPMMVAGDEVLRSQHGNNNAYNIDSACTWLDYGLTPEQEAFRAFTGRLFAFRAQHSAIRPLGFWSDAEARWLKDDGADADGGYLDAADRHFLGLFLDGNALGDAATAIYIAYNGWSGPVVAHLPPAPAGKAWTLVGDTAAAAEAWGNWVGDGAPRTVVTSTYSVDARSLAVWVAE
ncbi:MAG: alpha-amylase family glycosyl hydrolase [Myxococcota bacterium]